ncbi:MAG: hypothetical protein D6800_10935 [Candidatus Zixiibacteriota bacterium]|nr:MAG: hypothetical protein D6800_10935 [candidate division Zixibacteria bacterium]
MIFPLCFAAIGPIFSSVKKATGKSGPRPFIGIMFKCCHVYSRIYLNAAGTAFVGWCPRCAAKATVKVSPTGSRNRFFTAE